MMLWRLFIEYTASTSENAIWANEGSKVYFRTNSFGVLIVKHDESDEVYPSISWVFVSGE